MNYAAALVRLRQAADAAEPCYIPCPAISLPLCSSICSSCIQSDLSLPQSAVSMGSWYLLSCLQEGVPYGRVSVALSGAAAQVQAAAEAGPQTDTRLFSSWEEHTRGGSAGALSGAV